MDGPGMDHTTAAVEQVQSPLLEPVAVILQPASKSAQAPSSETLHIRPPNEPIQAPDSPPHVRRCNGQMSLLKPHSLQRALLAALLQTGWGVAPSYETWSVFHNATLHNWLWSVGRTPFGPLSDVPDISFVQRTGAQRNVVLTLLNQAVEEAGKMLRAVQVRTSEILANAVTSLSLLLFQ